MKKMTLKKLDLGLSLLAIIHKNIFESAFFFFFFCKLTNAVIIEEIVVKCQVIKVEQKQEKANRSSNNFCPAAF